MSTILPAHTQRAIHNLGMAAVHMIAAEYDCSPTDVLDLIVTAPFTPSQPVCPPPAVHAPAAPASAPATDGMAESSSLPTEPSVAPIHEPQPEMVVQTEVAPAAQASSPAESDAVEISAPVPEAPKPLPDDEEMRRPAEAKTSDQGALSSEPGGMQDECAIHPATLSHQAETLGEKAPAPCDMAGADKPGGASASSAPALHFEAVGTLKERVRAAHIAHPEWTARQIAEALKAPPSSVNATLTGVKREIRQQAQPPVETPPAATPSRAVAIPSATIPNEPMRHTPSIAAKRPASTRFYVVDKHDRFLHQSLEASPTDDGPLMTSNRHWAWFDNEQRFKGAAKKWPEIEQMRQEFPQ